MGNNQSKQSNKESSSNSEKRGSSESNPKGRRTGNDPKEGMQEEGFLGIQGNESQEKNKQSRNKIV